MANTKKRMRFNKIEAIKAHRQIWKWLSKFTKRKKAEWPGFANEYGDFYLKNKLVSTNMHCFLCTYAHDKSLYPDSISSTCHYCPLEWDVTESTSRPCENSYYAEWRSAYGNDKKRTELALKIASLKVKLVVPNKNSVWINKKG